MFLFTFYILLVSIRQFVPGDLLAQDSDSEDDAEPRTSTDLNDSEFSSSASDSNDKIELNMNRTKVNNKKCVLCDSLFVNKSLTKHSRPKLSKVIKSSDIYFLFSKTKIFIRENTRACSNHFGNDGLLKPDAVSLLKSYSILLN